ncbi:PAS domain S-box protein [Erythrobacter sp. T5W1-R]|uniref:hybrid sensor histidine kinase/response regulator n=1 Tax=Erythrobacter sp. T5W1-R TaxID=3101752 RepID=UPI002AFE441C|nr:PAS domain S-box protein [Erythrobacter sp. T5W1-R]MEA1618307.1 PAS domain S-box protein [Erythrobacter sp. T5W1-R]
MNEATYCDILCQISDGVAVFTKDAQVKYVNDAFQKLTGYEKSEINQKIVSGGLFMAGNQGAMTRAEAAIASSSAFAEDVLVRRKSGEPLWCHVSIKPHYNEDGSLRHFISIYRDISAQKAAEGKAAEVEGNHRFILDNVLAGVVVHGPDTKIRFVNRLASEVLRMKEDELDGVPTSDERWVVFREDGSPMPLEDFPANQAIRKKAPVKEVVHGLKLPDDDIILWLVANAFPVLDEQGEVLEVLVSFADITRLVEAEREAQRLRQRFELAVHATQDAVFEWNVKTGQFWANDAYKKIYGYDPPESIHLDNLEDISAVEADHDKVRRTTLDAISSGKERYALQYEFRRPDGTTGHAAVRGFIVRNDTGEAERIIGTTTDIGQLTEANAALEQSEERFRIIADATSDVLWDYNFETGVTWTGQDWPAKLGVQYDQRHIQNFQWIEMVKPSERAPLIKSFQYAIKSEASTWEFEFTAESVAGEAIDLAVKASILRNPDGRATRILGNMRNVTKEKRNQEGYTRARALEAVGQLTGGVAHDFNNLLMIILGNAELLETTALDESQAQAVAMIHRASSSAADLTGRLLTFSRQSQLRAGRVALTNLIPNTVALLRTGIAETIAIRCDLKPGVWEANVDGNALEQAIINLAVNARDAMPDGGEIIISAENHTLSLHTEPNLLDLEPGDYVVVSVADTGQGMPPEVLARAFEPFFTTKDIGEGTGLGLSTVFGFAKQSGGYATIKSEPGHGTTVRIYLPRFGSGEVPEFSLPKPEHGGDRTGQRILVVEDEAMVRAHVEKLLAKLGYVVTAAADAQEALSVLHDDQAFDLIFTDVIMPGGMTGPQLGQAALRLAPHIKLLYTSGYPATAFESLGLDDLSNVNFLAKPYRSEQLQQKLATILNA